MDIFNRNQFSTKPITAYVLYPLLFSTNKNNWSVSHIVKRIKKHSRTYLPCQDWSWVTNSHFPPVSWISYKTISMTCRRSTVGRVRTARQGLRIAAGSEWDEHTIRGKATRAYLPFHDGCHHLRVPSAAPPPRWEGFLAEPESFSFSCFRNKFWMRKLARPDKGAHESPWEGGRAKNEKSGSVNLGENDRIKYKEGEISSCGAYRARLNNAWICGGMALEHMQTFRITFIFNYKLLFSLSFLN